MKNSILSDTPIRVRRDAVLVLFTGMFTQGRGYFTSQDVDHLQLSFKREASEIQLADISLET